jgi:putative DNA primase/helicase
MSLIDQLRTETPDEAQARLLDAEKNKLRRQQQAKAAVAAEALGPVPTLKSYTGVQLLAEVFPPRQPMLMRDGQVFFAAGEIGEVFSTRGTGKTLFLMTLALAVANGGKALGFDAPAPRRVLYVDGEMARQDIQERYQMLCERTGFAMTERLVIVAADWQPEYLPRVDTPHGQTALEPFVDPAELIILDNRSCLLDPEGEKDPTAWQPTQDYLFSLRHRNKAILIAHHANRQGGARGLSKPEDLMNFVMKLTRPEDYSVNEGARFVCDCSPPDGKYRGKGDAAKPFGVKLTARGWELESVGKDTSNAAIRQSILDFLKNEAHAGNKVKSMNTALKQIGGNRATFSKVWGDLRKMSEITGDEKVGFTVGNVATNAPF